jgi:hypothetical protein
MRPEVGNYTNAGGLKHVRSRRCAEELETFSYAW